MFGKWLAVLGAVLLVAQCTGEPQTPKTVTFKTEKDKVSYGIGVSIAKNFKKQGIDVDVDILTRGLKDGLTGAKLLINEQELAQVLMAYQNKMQQKMLEARKKAGEANKKEGEAFLAANKKKKGVVALPSGLQYKILEEGKGKKPKAEDTVIVHYRGTLINGTEFDSSISRGQPVTVNLAKVIPGWREALQLMPMGSKWQLFIPANLAYGERGSGKDIGPDATLIFEVKLIGIK
ncbi:MAG: FKBP-type peptidyl-prolyl cis-trans isomerase [Syntrophales bacterium]|nr:FKBP-type peptidyl-prolyl cis-trans isomerase [Syntrophales bacterium]MDD5640092.1 FKBP-type peptidyl-prolyl cis-trans isomerase [Syntrophales bacterium]